MLFRFMVRLMWMSLGLTVSRSFKRFVGVTIMVVAFLMVVLAWLWTVL